MSSAEPIDELEAGIQEATKLRLTLREEMARARLDLADAAGDEPRRDAGEAAACRAACAVAVSAAGRATAGTLEISLTNPAMISRTPVVKKVSSHSIHARQRRRRMRRRTAALSRARGRGERRGTYWSQPGGPVAVSIPSG